MSNSSLSLDQFRELRSKLLFVCFALVIYRLCAHIPVPGVNLVVLSKLASHHQQGLLAYLNLFSGGALSRFTIVALGVMPYISASIITQLLSYTVPFLFNLRKRVIKVERKN